jgi:AraC-like DNA-binding protein
MPHTRRAVSQRLPPAPTTRSGPTRFLKRRKLGRTSRRVFWRNPLIQLVCADPLGETRGQSGASLHLWVVLTESRHLHNTLTWWHCPNVPMKGRSGIAGANGANPPLASLLSELVTDEGFLATALPDVRLMHSKGSYPPSPVVYEPSVVIIAQGYKRARLGGSTYVYDARNYLVLSVPLPFECETVGTSTKPMLGLAIRVSPVAVAEMLLEWDMPWPQASFLPRGIDAAPLTPELADAALRLAKCLHSPIESHVLGPAIIHEIIYRVLCDKHGDALRALATPRSNFSQIARSLRRIHANYHQHLNVASLARDASMSVSTFHANFKAVTSKSPLHYLQTIRLHKAQGLVAGGIPVAEAARQVGYESPSQFSREFKRLFGRTPKEVAGLSRSSLFAF